MREKNVVIRTGGGFLLGPWGRRQGHLWSLEVRQKQRPWAHVQCGPSGTAGTRRALMNSNGQRMSPKSQSDHMGRRQGTHTLEHGVDRPRAGEDKDMEMGIGHGHTDGKHKVGISWDAELLALLSVSVPAELQARLRMAALGLSISLCFGEEYPGPLDRVTYVNHSLFSNPSQMASRGSFLVPAQLSGLCGSKMSMPPTQNSGKGSPHCLMLPRVGSVFAHCSSCTGSSCALRPHRILQPSIHPQQHPHLLTRHNEPQDGCFLSHIY